MFKTPFRIIFKAASLAALLLFSTQVATGAEESAPTVKKTTVRKGKNNRSGMNKSENTFSNPDFAFPQTVEKNALPVWEKALREKDGLEALKAALQLTAAHNLISRDNFNANIEMLDSAVKVMPPVFASLFRLLEADQYVSLYRQNAWTYNQRVLPLDSFPSDPKSWSRDLFAKRVFQLVMRASDNPAESRKLPLRDISDVISNADVMIEAGCSVNDFIIFKSTELLKSFSIGGKESVIPFGGKSGGTPVGISSQCDNLSASLINTLLSYREREGNLPALALTVVRKSELLSDPLEKYSFLKKWKDKMMDSPADARVLVAYYNVCLHQIHDEEYDPKELYSSLNGWLEKFSQTEDAKTVKFCLLSLTLPKMSVSVPSESLPGQSIKGSVKLENVTEGYLLIYSVPFENARDGSFNVSKFPGNARFVKAMAVETAGSVPFTKYKYIDIDPLPAGYYVIVPSPRPTLPSNWKQLVDKWTIRPINVSEISILTNYNTLNPDSGKIFVVSAFNQKPIKGASVTVLGQNDKEIKSGFTDGEGAFTIPAGYSRTRVSYKDSHASSYSGFYASKNKFEPELRCNILTDLSIYRPGDEIKFALVEWMREERSNRLMPNEPISVVMRDANWNPVDTLSLTTDADGRANGSFRIPVAGLLGSYTLNAFSGKQGNNQGNNIAGRASFEVADYKTPGFIVNLEKGSESNFNAGDTIRFSGSVKTYSGMPLADAEVRYRITWQPWWRWGGNYSDASYGADVTTGSDGTFKITLPTEGLRGTRFEHGIFTLQAEATSSSGETQKAQPLRFSLGRDFSLRPEFADNIYVEGDSISLNVPVYDILGLPVIKDVKYEIRRIDSDSLSSVKNICDGVFVSPTLKIDSKVLPSGKYRIGFTLEGDTLKTERDLVIFRKDDAKPPYATPLWVPQTSYIAPSGSDKVDVEFGSGYSDSWILAVVSGPEGIISRKWINIGDENTHLSLPAPAEGTKTWLSLSGMRNMEQNVATITVEPASAKRKMEVKVSSFRDKLTAGDKERWSFVFSVAGSPVKDVPAFAVMTDKALNAISPFAWSFLPGRGFVANRTNISLFNNGIANMSAKFSVSPKYYGFKGFMPVWNTYQGFGTEVLSTVKLTSRKLSRGEPESVLAESVVNEVYMASADMAAEAPMAMKSAQVRGNGAVKEEMAVESDDMEAGVMAGGTAAPEEQLRPMELPLAFFMPNLKGDKDGNVEVEFEVPNFNTTWQFQILGYSPDLLTADLILDAVASKSVMVHSNAPRFLRTGDNAEISALVFNNSDKQLKLAGEITIFNPLTGETIYSGHKGAEPVEPSANRMISVSFTVPTDMNAIGIRTKGYSDNFSDGEQTIIPVLPSSTPVVESTQFYLGKERKSFSVQLPDYRQDANLTLRYCSNPVWECILALPAISTPDSKNVLTLMRALYANATASSIVARYPQVKAGLASLFKDSIDNPSLLSTLQKDESLKIVELINTPWVNNASSETLRLSSLSNLLQAQNAEKAVENLLKDVKGLQNSDGGWSWCNGMKSSEFITRSVLSRFAMLAHNKNLSSEALSMVKRGVGYCDKELYNDYVKSKHRFSTTDMLHYLYVRSSFEVGAGPTGFASLKNKALKAVADEWKEFSIEDKALAAMLMARSKGYERNAGIILESLKQFAVKDADKGWQFANLSSGYNGWNRLAVTATVLEAFAEIEPQAEAVDGLRQWLVLQKETEDWGSDSNTVEVIQAILNSGSDWIGMESLPEISLGGKSLSPDSSEQLTGILTLPLNPKNASGKELKISKNSEIPAWGAVISQYVAPIKEVRAEACENLKIEKQLLKIDANGNGEKAIKGELKVGDKVRVTLTVTCDKDMNYVAITDQRPACIAPDEQLSGYVYIDGRGMYREVRDAKTSLFISFLPKGVNVITYDCHVDRAGIYSNGIATVQSQYSPQQVAHSSGNILQIK